MNPLDELNSLGPKSKNDPQNKKKKQIKMNPLLKELLPVLYYLVGILVIVVVAKYTLFNEMSEYHYKSLTDGLDETENKVAEVKRNISTISQLEADSSQMKDYIMLKQEELREANLVRTPLEQSYYFTAYFDSLVKKHAINLIDIYIEGMKVDEGQEINPEVMNQLITNNPSLLPIVVEFEATYEETNKLFNDLYTKRIIYDEDLVMTNKYDGTVNVQMVVRFSKDETTDNEVIENQEVTEEEGVDDFDFEYEDEEGTSGE